MGSHHALNAPTHSLPRCGTDLIPLCAPSVPSVSLWWKILTPPLTDIEPSQPPPSPATTSLCMPSTPSTVEQDFDRIALVSEDGATHNDHYHNFLLRHL